MMHILPPPLPFSACVLSYLYHHPPHRARPTHTRGIPFSRRTYAAPQDKPSVCVSVQREEGMDNMHI